MKKIISLFFIIISSIATWYACLPYFPHNITIAKYLWSYTGTVEFFENKQNQEITFLALSRTVKPLPYFWQYILTSYDKHFINADNISLSWYKPWDIVILIDNEQWYPGRYNESHEYYITEIAKVIQSWDSLQLENKQGNNKNRDKPMRWCGNIKRNNVMTEQELINNTKPTILYFFNNHNLFINIWDKLIIRFLS